MDIDIPLSHEDRLVSTITSDRIGGGDVTTGTPATDSCDVRTRGLTRRRFVGALGARAAFAGLAAAGNRKRTVVAGTPASGVTVEPGGGHAAGHPGASPTAPARLSPFLALSVALVGGGELDEGRARQYLAFVDADAAKQRALDELLARAGKPWWARRLSSAARELRKEILEFWYLGTVDGQPMAGSAPAWATLHAWQAVQYTPAPGLCKGYGSWAPPQTGTGTTGA